MNSAYLQNLCNTTGAGREVVCPDGVYTIDGPVRPLAGQTIRRNATRGSVPLTPLLFTKTANCDMFEITVNDVTIIGAELAGGYNWSTGSGFTGNGIYAHGGISGLKIHNCKINNMHSSGVVMTGSYKSEILNNVFDSCGTGTVSGTPAIFGNFDAVDHIVENNTITMRNGGPHGIAYHTEVTGHVIQRVRIANNKIYNNGGGYCIEVGSFAAGGGDPERPRDIQVLDNVMLQTANCSGGISFDWCESVNVSDNFFRATGGTANAGIECVNGKRVRIAGNHIYGGGSVSIGIACDHEGSDLQIVSNIIAELLTNSQGTYIAARADATFAQGSVCIYKNVLVQGNVIKVQSGSDATGIRFLLQDGTQILEDIRILDNLITWLGAGAGNSGGVACGSAAANSHMKRIIIRGNHYENSHFGMYLQGFSPAVEPTRDNNFFTNNITNEHWD